MDYIGHKCPACNKYFHVGEDIVVCPECGTPHHRECYDELGHCFNAEKHSDGYDYTSDESSGGTAATIKCIKCGGENDADAFFCKHCSAPLSVEDTHQAQQPTGNMGGFPNMNGVGSNAYPFMDPMGGVAEDTELEDGITAGEIAKYVKQNTPYYMRVFNNIKANNKSRFCFTAALFAGGFLLYRKMYKIGAIITAIQLAILVFSTYITVAYSTQYSEMQSLTTYSQVMSFFSSHTSTEVFILYLPLILYALQLVLMIIIGITFNRLYYKHCVTEVAKIKANPGEESAETALQTKGGVNTPLAISLLVTYMLMNFIPRFFI